MAAGAMTETLPAVHGIDLGKLATSIGAAHRVPIQERLG